MYLFFRTNIISVLVILKVLHSLKSYICVSILNVIKLCTTSSLDVDIDRFHACSHNSGFLL